MDRQVLIHKHSSEIISGKPKSPSTGVLEKGEIAVNYNDASPSLFIETSSGNIVRFVDKTYIDSALASGETKNNKVTSLTSGSTDVEYPSAKAVYNAIQSIGPSSTDDISGKEDSSNKVTSISSASTDTQYPSAKSVYDNLKDNEKSHTHIITKNDVTVNTDSTKGVSPYNKSYGYTNITINTISRSDISNGTNLIFCCGGSLVVSSSYRNVRIRFGSDDSWTPVYYTTSIAGGSTYLINGACTMLVYRNDVYTDGAFHICYDVNSTYSNPASFGIGYGTCLTSEANTTKVVTLSSYTLQTNGIVSVKFTYGVPANATMTINGKDAKAIYYKGSAITAGIIKAGDIATFIYNGSQYHLLAIDSNIDGKVDKVEGKGLSTNDYTTAEQTKLANLKGVDVVASSSTTIDNDVKIWIDTSKNYGELDPTQVVQSTGQSTTNVMSQKAVTDAINSGGGGTPSAYIKSASVNGNTLSLTNKDDSQTVFTPTFTEQYKGTITGINMNGSSKGTSGVVNLGTVITEHQDISGKLDIQQSSSDYGKPIIVGEDGRLYADYHKYLHSVSDIDGLPGELANKMSALNAGTGIQIVNNTISCTVSSGTVDLSTIESNVSSLNDATFDISSNVGEIQSGKMYDYDANTIKSFNGTCSCTVVQVEEGAEYYASTSMVAQSTCFPLITYFASDGTRLGYEYMNPSDVEIKIVDKKLNLPDNTAYFYMNSRYITWQKVDIKTSKITNLRDDMYDYVEIEPDEKMTGKLYYYTENRLANVSDGRVYKITISEGVRYYLTSSIIGNDTGFPIVSFFDSSDTQLGYQFMNQASVQLDIVDQLITVPDGTAYMYINARGMDATINGYVSKISGGSSKKEIKILFVGNSLTQDGIAYLPYILKVYYPEIKFKIYMWYNGGYTLAEHYTKFINNQSCEIFSIAENNSTWTNTNMTMANILSTYKFDIVSLQEYFNYKGSYTVSDLADWNNCRNYIRDNYTGGNPLKFVSLFHAPKRSSADTIYNITKTGNDLILSNTISQGIIPNGIAVYKALSTSLDSLGDQQHLTPDGTHTQEGLPCLLQTYVSLLWVFRELGINKSIYGHPMRMNTTIYNNINVPGANLGTGVITGTDAENILAQEVAIMAFKEYYPL